MLLHKLCLRHLKPPSRLFPAWLIQQCPPPLPPHPSTPKEGGCSARMGSAQSEGQIRVKCYLHFTQEFCLGVRDIVLSEFSVRCREGEW